MTSFVRLGVVVSVALTLAGCNRQEPTTARGGSETSKPATRHPEPIAAPRTVASSAPHEPGDAALQVPDAGLHGQGTEPSLFAEDGGALPQTEDRPALNERFQARMALLFEAIRADDPARAHSVFFPLLAYRQVKAIADPDRDYQRRLLRAFDRDIHDYHRKLGIADAASPARLTGVAVPEAQARWMKPGSEGNKLGYWRVLRSALGVTDGTGTERKLAITSLISWRGEWYVVHLNGFE
ncbi:MAG TPA: hypothetical protein VK524_08500 [Polyangiaceae bacterium]|nr:hypothetical protein [Polyangiaceae bacterium]